MMRELVGGRSAGVLRKMQRAVLSGTLNIVQTIGLSRLQSELEIDRKRTVHTT